jgi:hypothetical protein
LTGGWKETLSELLPSTSKVENDGGSGTVKLPPSNLAGNKANKYKKNLVPLDKEQVKSMFDGY